MSRFRNNNAHALSFTLGGRHINVEPGEEISIAPKLAFAIHKMGVLLTAVDNDEDELAQAASEERPTETTALLWYGRAVEQRRLLIATQGELSTAEHRLSAANDEISAQSSQLIAANDDLVTLTAERTALLARVAILEEAATAPAPADTASAPAPKGKGKTPAADPTP